MTHTLPLLRHPNLDSVFAWRPDGPVTVREFLADVEAMGEWLPQGDYLLNVCQDRYRFAVALVAGLLHNKVSLQPASQSAETLSRIEADYPGVTCICDGEFDSRQLPRLDFPQLAAVDRQKDRKIPEIPADRLTAILFTSGSTGVPQPHRKTWGKLVASGHVEARRFGFIEQPHSIVGTVPVQHSYGFESTLMMALQSGSAFWSGKPFYPQDIVAALAAMPAPRMLVTTPFHLSALLAAEIELPEIDRLLSATAPLSLRLAGEAEARTGAPLHEIYGSTESGQVASRQTTADPAWELLDDVCLTQEDDQTTAHGGHVEGRITLSDVIELLPDRHFLLHGRHTDLINIAGKRTSLAYLNHQIAAVPGVLDGAFFLPDDEQPDGITRLSAFVVAPGLSSRQLLVALRERIDPIFLPRPLVVVEALPRNTTGKLPRQALQALYADHAKR